MASSAAPVQIVDGDGRLLAESVQAVAATSSSAKYKVISVLGSQGSGKSTLLNSLVRLLLHFSRYAAAHPRVGIPAHRFLSLHYGLSE